ncbi:hypothetical protein C8T65DRAFT_654675 [Cerioporus squamosus]|nr:hypothetical protein C8T65DRAFT_654675 [Cerioporus squamosus]
MHTFRTMRFAPLASAWLSAGHHTSSSHVVTGHHPLPIPAVSGPHHHHMNQHEPLKDTGGTKHRRLALVSPSRATLVPGNPRTAVPMVGRCQLGI